MNEWPTFFKWIIGFGERRMNMCVPDLVEPPRLSANKVAETESPTSPKRRGYKLP